MRDSVVRFYLPFDLVRDGLAMQRVDTLQKNALVGKGKLLGTRLLGTNKKGGVPVLVNVAEVLLQKVPS
jgi:hypothetical protein